MFDFELKYTARRVGSSVRDAAKLYDSRSFRYEREVNNFCRRETSVNLKDFVGQSSLRVTISCEYNEFNSFVGNK